MSDLVDTHPIARSLQTAPTSPAMQQAEGAPASETRRPFADSYPLLVTDNNLGTGPLDADFVPDRHPFVRREIRYLQEGYMTRLGILLCLVCMAVFLVRLAAGHLPLAPDWLNITVLVVSSSTTVLLGVAQRRRQPVWLYMAFGFVGTTILTFLLLYFGTDGTFTSLYFLCLLVPTLFFSIRWAVTGAVIVSGLSTLPYVLGPNYSYQALLGHVIVDIPVYFVVSICVNIVLAGMREKWLEGAKLRRLARDFAVIQQLTTYISSTHDINSICDTVVSKLCKTFGYRYVSIYLVQGDRLKLIAQRGYPHRVEDVQLGKGVMSRVATTGDALLVKDARDVPDFIYQIENIRCEVSAPIKRRLKSHDQESASVALGVINLEDTLPGALGEADLNLIKTIAGALSVALENANLMRQWQERGERLEMVNQVAQAVAAKTDLSGVLKAARTSLQSFTQVDRVTLSLLTDDGEFMEVAALEGVDSTVVSQVGTLIPIEDFQPASVLQGQYLVIPDLGAGSEYTFASRLYEVGLRSHVAMPLVSRDKVVGVFALSSFEPFAYTEAHLPVLESIVPHLATAVQNAILYRDIRQRAESDTLTKLYNLPTFYSRLNSLISEAEANEEPLTVVMLDLDLFKSYNDSFGHVAGDSVLRQVAALIRQSLRSEDVAARYGGDEFAVIVPGIAGDEALQMIARLCETIGRTPFQPETRHHTEKGILRSRGVAMLSASAGLASYPGDSTDPEHLVHLADTALYEAKRRGRNRACAYNPSGPSRTPASDKEDAARRKRYQGLSDGDTDPQLDASEARESRAAMNDYLQAVYALVSAVELRDGYTHGHSERVAFYAVRLGEALGLGSHELSALRIAALLHDIGKIALPYDVIHKPGKLTPEEWELVKQHPLHGEGILRPLRNFSAVWPMVSSHHENFDGSGYPRQLMRDAIPVGGRILRIADSYEVMTVAGRAYQKQARTPLEAVAELKRCAGTMFDPAFVEVFIDQVIGDPRSSLLYNAETNILASGILDSTDAPPARQTDILPGIDIDPGRDTVSMEGEIGRETNTLSDAPARS